MKLKSSNYRILPMIAAALASVASVQGATTFGFVVGATAGGDFAIQTFSNSPTVQLFGFQIDLETTPGSDTFFDSFGTAPGLLPQGFTTVANLGGIGVSYPDDAATDGTQFAAITTTGFDPGDALNFFVDLDLFTAPDGSGNPLGATITGVFVDTDTFTFLGSTSVTLQATPVTINGRNYTFSAAIPEPSTALLGGLGALALLRRRR
jgi:hypothetical protein